MATNWATAILAGIGAPASSQNVAKLSAWNACEGNLSGHSGLGANNPFNTTLNYGGGVSVNSAGVKDYPSLSVGIAATIQTMLGSRYTAIVSNLRNSGSDSEFASAVGSSPWGTSGSCIGNVLGSGSAPAVGGPSVSPSTGGGTTPSTGTTPAGGTQTAQTTATDAHCLWSLGVVGCIITKSQARAVVGGLLLASGLVIGLVGLNMLLKAAGLGGSGLGKAAATGGEMLALFPPAEGAGVALSAAGGSVNRTAAHRARGRAAATGERRAATGEKNAVTAQSRAATGAKNAKTAKRRAGTYEYRAETDRKVGTHRAKTYRKDAGTRRYAAETGRQRETRLASRPARPRPAPAAKPAPAFRSEAYR